LSHGQECDGLPWEVDMDSYLVDDVFVLDDIRKPQKQSKSRRWRDFLNTARDVIGDNPRSREVRDRCK
jgi:hypothetical protein